MEEKMKKNSGGLKTAAALVAALALVGFLAPRASWGLAAATDPAAENLSRALQFQTISFQDASAVDAGTFLAFHAFLEKTFPLIHQRLTREVVGDLGLVYTWKGADPAAKPIILLAHMDVVPIAPGTLPDWTYPPFEGRIADGFIWGRGSMDCKGILMAIMESVEGLLAQGYQPRRTVYLCFGHDEEVGGWRGAAKIAALLKSRGVTAEFVIDEGGMIVDGKVMGIAKPLAMIGIAEKGYLSLELTVKTAGGHSSMPPRETAIGILAAAITRLQANPFPAKIGGVSALTMERLAPEMPSALRFALKNRWLFGPVIEQKLAQNAATDAMIRTTTAPTIIAAGTKENVLPQEARAVVNFRLLPGDRVADVIARVNKTIADPRVAVATIGVANEASSISSIDSPGFKILERTITDLFPETVIAPYLVLGGTDSRLYEPICDSIFRFAPMRIGPEDQERAHGTNERIGVANYHELIAFYTRLIRNSD
jgi:carboxypeptidase PM20D1